MSSTAESTLIPRERLISTPPPSAHLHAHSAQMFGLPPNNCNLNEDRSPLPLHCFFNLHWERHIAFRSWSGPNDAPDSLNPIWPAEPPPLG